MELDICPICGESVNRRNLLKHYKKVHPRRISSLATRGNLVNLTRRPRIKHPRRIVFYVLILVSVAILSIVATQFISANTVRLSIKPELSVLIEGGSVTVPANIGIEKSLWVDHSLDRFGVGGKSPLQTRDTSGTIYVESNTIRNFTLHEFLMVWGQSVDSNQVLGNSVPQGESACTVVNGVATPVSDAIVFSDQQAITLEIISGSCSAIS